MLSLSENQSASSANNAQPSEPINVFERPSTGFSIQSSTQKSRSTLQTQMLLKRRISEDQQGQLETVPVRKDETSVEEITVYPVEQKPYQHDILIIQTQPPKVRAVVRFRMIRQKLNCMH